MGCSFKIFLIKINLIQFKIFETQLKIGFLRFFNDIYIIIVRKVFLKYNVLQLIESDSIPGFRRFNASTDLLYTLYETSFSKISRMTMTFENVP